VETIVAPNMNVVRRVVIGFAINLGHGSSGFSVGRNLNRSSGLAVANTRVVATPQMVFTNPIMTTHVHKTTHKSPRSLIDVGGYKSTNAKNPKGWYKKPFVIIQGILDHKKNHFVRPNRVAYKYLDFKKDANRDVHVRVFNYVGMANVKTFKEYIINAFNHTLKNTSLNWCYNYMIEFHDYIFSKLT
jgi:hypothetical protein